MLMMPCSSRRLLAADAHDAKIVGLPQLMLMMSRSLPAVFGMVIVAADAHDAGLAGVWCGSCGS